MNDERPGGPIRIGDKEREDAVKRLGEHYEAGRLTAEEHTERIGRALEGQDRGRSGRAVLRPTRYVGTARRRIR